MEENVVTAADDADIGAILGWGFAPWSGGVISYVNDIGPAQFLRNCEALEARFGRRFQPPQLLKDMVAKGDTFYDEAAEPELVPAE